MKQSISVYQFRDAFQKMGRGEQFSYDGLGALFEYLEQLGDDTGEEIELDVIALCCDFAQEDAQAIAENYNIDISDCTDEDEISECVAEYLQNEGVLVATLDDNSILYQQF